MALLQKHVWTDPSYGPTADGQVTVNGATEVVVNSGKIQATSGLVFGLASAGGTVAAVFQSSVVAGTSFGVKSTAGNTSTYNYWIL